VTETARQQIGIVSIGDSAGVILPKELLVAFLEANTWAMLA